MTRDLVPPEQRAAALRAEFDQSFGVERSAPVGTLVELLAIRVAGHSYALRLSEVGLIAVDRRITRLPSPQPALTGLCTVRGHVVAVYDLGAILGHARTGSPRWVMQASRSEPIALAFEAFEGQLRIDAAQIATHGPGRALVHQVVDAGGPARPIVDVAAVVAEIEQRIGPEHPVKER